MTKSFTENVNLTYVIKKKVIFKHFGRGLQHQLAKKKDRSLFDQPKS